MTDGVSGILPIRERMQWAGLGFLAGILIGLIMGWLFHNVVGSIIQLFLVLALITPFVIAWLFWRRTKTAVESATSPPPGHDPALREGETFETTSYRVTEGTRDNREL